MGYRGPPKHLYVRILVAIVLSITLVLTIVTGLTIRDSQRRLRDELVEHGFNQLKVLTYAASVYMAHQDAHQLILTGEAATTGGHPLFVAFYAPTGALLAAVAAPMAPDAARITFGDLPRQAQRSGDAQIRWSADYLELAQPIDYQGLPVGVVALRMSAEDLEASFYRELTQSLLTTLVLIAVLSLVIGLLLRQIVIKPLARLNAASDQISRGAWVPPPGQERQDELGQLARSFERMLSALHARESELREQVAATQQLNAELDARVARRTAELNLSQLNEGSKYQHQGPG